MGSHLVRPTGGKPSYARFDGSRETPFSCGREHHAVESQPQNCPYCSAHTLDCGSVAKAIVARGVPALHSLTEMRWVPRIGYYARIPYAFAGGGRAEGSEVRSAATGRLNQQLARRRKTMKRKFAIILPKRMSRRSFLQLSSVSCLAVSSRPQTQPDRLGKRDEDRADVLKQ
jgi:hypothetical protein